MSLPTRAEIRIAIALLMVGVILAIPAVYGRYQVEQAYRTYELTVDFASLRLLAEAEGLSLTEVAKTLKDAGATSLSVHIQTVADLLVFGNAIFVPADGHTQFSHAGNLDEFAVAGGVLWLPRGFSVQPGLSPLAFNRTYVGLDPDAVATAKAAGLQLVPKIPFVSRLSKAEITQIFTHLRPLPGRPVIFEGETILGYPDRLSTVSENIERYKLLVGQVEFSNQKGLGHLADKHLERLVRVHTITAEETDLVGRETAIARWVRAVGERTMRLLYFHPYLPHSVAVRGSDSSALEVSVQTLKAITAQLAQAGYRTGVVSVLPVFPLFDWGFVGAVLGLAALAYILLRLIVGSWWNPTITIITVTIGLVASAVLVVLYYLGFTVLARQIAALGIAIVFPALTVLIPSGHERPVIISLLQVLVLLFAGVILIIAALAQPEFILKTRQFFGVKLMHVVPPAIVAWVFWRQGRFKNWVPNRLTWLILPLALLAGVYLVLRTGNISAVSNWERQVRDLLEQLLVARPRTKEFMLGHPALVAGLWFHARPQHELLGAALLTIGTIGVLSVLNTFTHAHTPLLVSALRTVNGLWLGGLIGVVGVILIGLAAKEERR